MKESINKIQQLPNALLHIATTFLYAPKSRLFGRRSPKKYSSENCTKTQNRKLSTPCSHSLPIAQYGILKQRMTRADFY